MDGVKMTQEDSIVIDKISASEHSVCISEIKQTMYMMFPIDVDCLLTPRIQDLFKLHVY